MKLAVNDTYLLKCRIVFFAFASLCSLSINAGIFCGPGESGNLYFFEEPVIGFSGVLAPAQWTFTSNGGDGYVNTWDAPVSVDLYGSDNQTNSTNYTLYCINIPGTHPGVVAFNWNYQTFDIGGPQYDPFGLSINGVNTQLTLNAGGNSQSGNYQYLAESGDLFCFYVYSTDQRSGRGSVSISNFSYSPQVFTTITSSGTYTVPPNVTEITVQAWGAGAGGATSNNTGKGGGGGGAYASGTFNVTPGTTHNITIGNGGGPDVDGGLTQFGSGTQVLARGGSAGNNSNGGDGGDASTSVGTIRFSGGNGGDGASTGANRTGGGGGGSAFEASDGNDGNNGANNNPGSGGSGSGNGGNGGMPNGNGQSGFVPGGGGGGGGRSGTSGTGARGQIIINHNFPLTPDPNQCTIVSDDTEIPADGLSSTLITVQAKTSSGANIPYGGASVTLSTSLGILSSVSDNSDGTYTAILSSGLQPGTAVITGVINAQNIIATAEVEFTSINDSIVATITSGTSWYMISSPSPSVTYDNLLSNFVTQGFSGSTYPARQPNLLWFDETDTLTSNMSWRTINSIGQNVTPGRGYFLFVFGDIASDPLYNLPLPRNLSIPANSLFSNNSFTYNQSTFPLTYTPRMGTQEPSGPLGDGFIETNIADRGWNLLGNPTGESLNWGASSGWTKTNLDNSIYIWDPADSEFKVFNGVTGSHNGHIAPFQSYWVRANAVNPELGFNNQVFTDDGIFQRNDNPEHITLPIELKHMDLRSQAFVSFMEGAGKATDKWDAYLLEPLSEKWLTLFTCPSQFNKIPLAINSLPIKKDDEFISIPLYINGIDKGESIHGIFSLNWTLPDNWPEEWTVELHDHLRSKAISMKDNGRYEFFFKTETSAQGAPSGSDGMKDLPVKVVNYSLPEGHLSSRDQDQPFSIIIHKNGHDRDPQYLSKKMKLINVFPNPFNELTKIQIEMPEPGFADLELYDISGKLIDFKKQIALDGGRQQIEYMPDELKAGLYVLHVKSVFGNAQLKVLHNK